MTSLDQEAREAAQEAAIKMLRERGNPHWHDMRDMYVLGAAFGRSQMLKELRSESAWQSHCESAHESDAKIPSEWADWLEKRMGEKT